MTVSQTPGAAGDVPGAATVEPPDEQARADARRHLDTLTKPVGSLGRLEDLVVWLAGVQRDCPPRPPTRPAVLVIAGDHGVARRGVSAYPAEVTRQMVANFLDGGAAVNVLARAAGATVRVEDIAVDGDTPPAVSARKIRRGSGSIDAEDALTVEEAERAYRTGLALADDEIDRGSDLLIPADMGIGNTTVAAVLVATLTGSEPVQVVGRGTGVDDVGWMRKVAAVRDAMYRARHDAGAPLRLLARAGGADFAAMTGLCVRAAERRTPVLLDGVTPTTCALLADVLAPGARAYFLAGTLSPEPAQHLALDRLGLVPLLDLGLRLGEGSGALAALPLLRDAALLAREMATFDSAQVSRG